MHSLYYINTNSNIKITANTYITYAQNYFKKHTNSKTTIFENVPCKNANTQRTFKCAYSHTN